MKQSMESIEQSTQTNAQQQQGNTKATHNCALKCYKMSTFESIKTRGYKL